MTSPPTTYSRWTRRSLSYLPVHREGRLIGYLWASTEHSVPLRTYADDTGAPVRYLPVRLDSTVAGYIWAATTGEAGGYLLRKQAGRAGEIAAGLWQLRFSDAYLAGQPATVALTRCLAAVRQLAEETTIEGEAR